MQRHCPRCWIGVLVLFLCACPPDGGGGGTDEGESEWTDWGEDEGGTPDYGKWSHGSCSDEMCTIPGGSFYMGCTEAGGLCEAGPSDSGCSTHDQPCHPVHLPAFQMDRTEVTIEAYGACVDAGACKVPTTGAGGADCNWKDRVAYAKLPVNCVNRDQGDVFCRWAGKRLCTDAEWERAATGDDQRLYPWGNEPPTCDRAVFEGCNCDGRTCPVGTRPRDESPYGVRDLAGNVTEWLQDRTHASYDLDQDGWQADGDGGNDAPADGSAWMAGTESYVLRGRSFESMVVPMFLRDSSINIGKNAFGFRCCR